MISGRDAVAARARQLFAEIHGDEPTAVVVAPGRINLIGEHTDYAGGLCLPAAVDRYVAVAAAVADGLAIASEGRPPVVVDLMQVSAGGDWWDLTVGVVLEVQRLGATGGLRLAIASDVPGGAGLSSSAAVAVGVAMAALRLGHRDLPPMEVARLCQRAENNFLGVPSGLMDEVAVLMGRQDHALLFDAAAETTNPVPLPPSFAWLVCESGVERTLRGSGYLDRALDAEVALQMARLSRPGLGSLADLRVADVEALRLPEPLGRRARHIAGEVMRVRLAVACLEAGNLEAMGELLLTSHRSLARDAEVSTPELDDLVEVAIAAGAAGARMMGAGFGGSVLALADAGIADDVMARVRRRYRGAREAAPAVHRVAVVDGAVGIA